MNKINSIDEFNRLYLLLKNNNLLNINNDDFYNSLNFDYNNFISELKIKLDEFYEKFNININYQAIGDFYPLFKTWIKNKGYELNNQTYYTERNDVIDNYNKVFNFEKKIKSITLSELIIKNRKNENFIIHQIINSNIINNPLLVSYGDNLKKLSNWIDETKVKKYTNRKLIADDFIIYINSETFKTKLESLNI